MAKTVISTGRVRKLHPIFDWVLLLGATALLVWNVVVLFSEPPNSINNFPANTALSATILVGAIGNFAENFRWRAVWLGISMLLLGLTFWFTVQFNP